MTLVSGSTCESSLAGSEVLFVIQADGQLVSVTEHTTPEHRDEDTTVLLEQKHQDEDTVTTR